MARINRALRLGIIGLGQAGAMIIDEIKAAGDLPWTIAAAADPREHATKHFRDTFGAPVYRDAEELCAASDVDVVYVATQPWDHLAHTRAAAKHGKHVICEKPMALSLGTPPRSWTQRRPAASSCWPATRIRSMRRSARSASW
jgi:phthalate 4,5-cis-dihydrodiol dehydrogenase